MAEVPPSVPESSSGSDSPISSGRRQVMEEWAPPEEFDEYRLVRPLGRGSMGQVFLAQDRVLDRPVAIKFISSLHASKTERERFMVEARAAARLHHPNIMAIHRVGELDGHPYLVSEYIHGRSLNDLTVPLSWQQVHKMAIGLARGLANAHRHGVLHRDIKLANVMLSDAGEVKILDFSLAKLMKDPTRKRRRERRTGELAARGAAEAVDGDQSQPGFEAPGALGAEAPAGEGEGEGHASKALPADVRSRIAALGAVPHAATMARAAAEASAIADTARRDAGARPLDPLVDSRRAPSLTQVGALMGTPHYMAPELWHGEPASRASDIYAVGVVLYALVTGRTPYAGLSLTELAAAILEGNYPPILQLAPAVDPRFAAIVDRCLTHNPAQRYTSGEELRSALELMTPSGRTQQIPTGNPYRGLRAFEAEHRSLFFGRSVEVRAVVERLRADPFVLVAGDSGVGKSSLCRAGVVPLIEDGAIEPERMWKSFAMMPGRRPLQVLVSSLATRLEVEEETLHSLLVESPMSFGWFLRKQLGGNRGLLIFIDQLEEMVTIADKEQAKVVGGVLAQIAAGVPGVRLFASARGDFLTRVAEIPELGEEISRAIYLLRPLTREGAREAIVGPAQLQGARFESDALVNDLVDAGIEGSLPLLQFALAELWEVRDTARGVISRQNLEQIGGVTGALARHGDGVLAALLPVQRTEARRILVRLVTIEDTRANLSAEELTGEGEAARGALEALVKARLLVVRETADGVIYEIAHEALVHGWGTLRGWLDEEREGRILLHSLETAASEWERLGKSRDALWGAAALARAGAFVDEASLRPRERDFLAASRRAVARGRTLRRAAFLAIPLVLGAVYGAVKVQEYRALVAKVEGRIADARAAIDDAHVGREQLQRRREEAFRRFDSRDPEGGEAEWGEAVALTPKVDRSYKQALQAVEGALILDPGSEEARSILAETLYERALLAEQGHDTKQVEELRERLDLYDEAGEYRARWEAPGRLRINVRPAGTRVTVAGYVKDAKGRVSLGSTSLLGDTPVNDATLAPGSYLLVFTRGESSINYPLLVQRGEELEIGFEMPEAGGIPDGYVYIPPGRFLFGSADDETMRRSFFNAPPVHNVTTGAYLISKREVTFGEWFDFVRAQPMAERARRLTHESRISVDLVGEDAFTLSVTEVETPATVGLGQPYRYASRADGRDQEWTRWPVVGISPEDAQAYVRWLADTGRLPGARLCDAWEWERALRGADSRRYPHGDDLQPGDANFDQTYGGDGKGLDEVGGYPASRSPFGVDDIIGNAMEWVASAQDAGMFELRGGSFYYDTIMAHGYNRAVMPETFREWSSGLRVCASAPATPR